MSYYKTIVTFLDNFSHGEIISILIAFIIFIATIIFIIWWDRRKSRQNKVEAFIGPLLRLNTIIETKSIPDRASYGEFINQFAIQENAMSIIRNRMSSGTKANFDKKWAEYKEEREGYKSYWDTNLKGKLSVHKSSKRLKVLIDELINIANKI